MEQVQTRPKVYTVTSDSLPRIEVSVLVKGHHILIRADTPEEALTLLKALTAKLKRFADFGIV